MLQFWKKLLNSKKIFLAINLMSLNNESNMTFHTRKSFLDKKNLLNQIDISININYKKLYFLSKFIIKCLDILNKNKLSLKEFDCKLIRVNF